MGPSPSATDGRAATDTCRFLLAASTLTFAFAPALTQTQAAPPHPTHSEASATPAAPQLQAALRQLWLGHVTHTREYAFAVKAADTASANRAAQAVVHNASSWPTPLPDSMARPPARRCWPCSVATGVR